MTTRMSVAEFHAMQAKTAKPGKYRSVPVVVDGIRFDSKREANTYRELMELKRHGFVSYFLRQVPIHLPGGTRLVVDFQVHFPDGRVQYLDAKGIETAAFKIKRREIEAAYPIKVETI